jgi:precorrin-2 methylase
MGWLARCPLNNDAVCSVLIQTAELAQHERLCATYRLTAHLPCLLRLPVETPNHQPVHLSDNWWDAAAASVAAAAAAAACVSSVCIKGALVSVMQGLRLPAEP